MCLQIEKEISISPTDKFIISIGKFNMMVNNRAAHNIEQNIASLDKLRLYNLWAIHTHI